MEEFEDNPRKVKKYETKFKESWLINKKSVAAPEF